MKCLKNTRIRLITVFVYFAALLISSTHTHTLTIQSDLSWDTTDSWLNNHDILSCGIVHFQKEISSTAANLTNVVAILSFTIFDNEIVVPKSSSSLNLIKSKRAPPPSFVS